MERVEIKIKGMTCEHCVRRVERAILSTGKAKNVEIDLATGKVVFEKEESLSLDEIKANIELYGYQVEV
uniref:Heavy-metal-associated domain-containing protein n=1 Tax=Caldimicrobium thiodismutans TaxID=1653476 RepID=A0A832LVA2_9BACT